MGCDWQQRYAGGRSSRSQLVARRVAECWFGTIVLVAERAAVERELEEIRAQLNWVRDYL